MINPTMPIFAKGQFRKATRSAQDPQACVAVARGRGWVEIRDTKQEWGGEGDHRLAFTAAQFDTFLAEVLDGTGGLCIEITRRGDDVNEFRSTVPQSHDNVLIFTDEEITAFLHAVAHGEFAESTYADPVAV